MAGVIIDGVGSYIPTRIVKNEDFLNADFYQENGEPFPNSNEVIIQKFEKITGIKERRYVEPGQTTSDIAAIAAKNAIANSSVTGEDLDYIIVAHNFGNLDKNGNRTDMMPSLAARVKEQLAITNPNTTCFDLIFGCPGWLQGAIQATQMIRSGDAKAVMVIGAETLSNIVDDHDRDSMIFADGAGATIFTASNTPGGYISQCSRTDAQEELNYLAMGKSFKPDVAESPSRFIKMKGRKIYEYALVQVASAIKCAIDKAGLGLDDISKVLIHQANAKMDEAILLKLFKLYGVKRDAFELMPMTIEWLGNSSVATIPTMLDLLQQGKIEGHSLNKGDKVVFASVGAGMHINAMVYEM
ncbi:3-oxoacyl-[acyl-carrier-protein] synthase-3 [Roseivirga pacifica]|uniref:3-oxoacyl-[acyl-carrier-protein] synthase-3 n=1 Tax=Roseivirga pacifica TaxID=1267423 RepID=A0A1I0MIJ3_9BACT|nr:ketoacyl-ACP synthase III [Roseivirga pacifica]RKQ50377.1 3-oxoacyl-[acyl-carrier-protein] synthase-3 [Roseivirga pacifica]SEV87361.1 3-oxoacyl-[acyl-carrier-protein] synthase-3 [Roseivirga pacifica]